MSQNESSNYRSFGRLIISINELNNNHWSPCIERQLLEELQSHAEICQERPRRKLKSENKAIYVLIGMLALLSIGICKQADSIAQTLREVARTSVLQVYPK
jgi:hypothetical protein